MGIRAANIVFCALFAIYAVHNVHVCAIDEPDPVAYFVKGIDGAPPRVKNLTAAEFMKVGRQDTLPLW